MCFFALAISATSLVMVAFAIYTTFTIFATIANIAFAIYATLTIIANTAWAISYSKP